VRALVLASLLLVDCAPAANCDTACADSVTLEAMVNATTTQLAGATLSECRNTACATGTLGAAGGSPSNLAGTLVGAFSVSVSVSATGSSAAVMTDTSGGGGAFVDGDVWSLTLTSAMGEQLLDAGSAVDYQAITSCTNTCKQADLALTP
jgi:hypothetical protein